MSTAINASGSTADALCAALSNVPSLQSCVASSTSEGYVLQLFTRPLRSSDSCDSFLLLPAENTWHVNLRAVLYCAGLLWCCLGLAAITGVFMKALEHIVSTHVEVRRRNPLTGVEQRFYERYWNGTIANLTLLALGTSAPEVLLALIDAIKNLGKPAGVLGPGTIIGSAAFNLLVILAVCVVAPKPTPEVRKIGDYPVFVLELAASLWAYVWLLLILKVISPDRIEIWEAAATLAQFPLFVLAAYGQDQGWAFAFLGQVQPNNPSTLPHSASTGSLDGLSAPTSPDSQSTGSFALGSSLHQNLRYRAKAVKMVTLMGAGGPPPLTDAEEAEGLAIQNSRRESTGMSSGDLEEDLATLDVSEGQWYMVAKYGNNRLVIHRSDEDAEDDNGNTISFTIGVSTLSEPLRLEHYCCVDDGISSPRDFFLGQQVLDLEDLTEHEPMTERLELEKKDGSLAGRDSVRVTLELRGRGGEDEYELAVQVAAPDSRGPQVDGGPSQRGSLANLLPPPQPASPRRTVRRGRRWQRLKRQWALQFFDAMTAGAREDDEPDQDPSSLDLLLHFCAFYWKLVFAFIPPPTIWGGWAAFLSCLLVMGCITTLLEEFSLLFACASGLKPYVTAVTFVAVGTSLPDLFASKLATELSREADSAIANINGSNSVNVFLGLGLPWLITAVYDQVTQQKAVSIATAGAYTVSLLAFFATAVVCVGVLVIRRQTVGGELGGPRGPAWATAIFFTFLWVAYIAFSTLEAYQIL